MGLKVDVGADSGGNVGPGDLRTLNVRKIAETCHRTAPAKEQFKRKTAVLLAQDPFPEATIKDLFRDLGSQCVEQCYADNSCEDQWWQWHEIE